MSARVRVIDDLPARAAQPLPWRLLITRQWSGHGGAAAFSSGLAGDARLNYTARDDVTPSGLPQEASE